MYSEKKLRLLNIVMSSIHEAKFWVAALRRVMKQLDTQDSLYRLVQRHFRFFEDRHRRSHSSSSSSSSSSEGAVGTAAAAATAATGTGGGGGGCITLKYRDAARLLRRLDFKG